MTLGVWQIAIIIVLIVLLFGRGKISELMGDVAKGIKSFKSGLSDDESNDKDPKTIHQSREENLSESETVHRDRA